MRSHPWSQSITGDKENQFPITSSIHCTSLTATPPVKFEDSLKWPQEPVVVGELTVTLVSLNLKEKFQGKSQTAKVGGVT